MRILSGQQRTLTKHGAFMLEAASSQRRASGGPAGVIRAACVLAAVLLGLVGCQSPPATRTGGEQVEFSGVSSTELQEQLIEFSSRFDMILRDAANRIDNTTDDREIRRMTLMWRMQVIPATHDFIFQADPRQSLLDLWGLCVVQQEFFSSEDNPDLPDSFREIAREAAESLTRNIEELASSVLPPSSYERAKSAVYEFAKANTIRGLTQTDWKRPSTVAERQPAAFQAILAVPFKALGGVDTAGVAIADVARAARHFTLVTRSLPERVRWQTELLLYDIEDRTTVVQAMENFASIAASTATFVQEVSAFNATTDRLVSAVESLPVEIRSELRGALDDMADSQEVIRDTTRTINESLDKIERASVQLASAGTAWTGTTKAIDELIGQFQSSASTPQSSSDAGSKPFDINDYARTAERMTELAVQLQQTIAKLDATAASGHLARGISDSVAAGEASALRVIHALMWRTIWVALLVFGLVVVYRVVFGGKRT